MDLRAGTASDRDHHRPGLHRLLHELPHLRSEGCGGGGQGPSRRPLVNAMVVPGSGIIKREAEQEGLDKIFREAGFEWREAGCSMCLGMNPDTLDPGQRCASTSNRNFEGRQGRGGRTHLVSPAMAAAAAIPGHFVDIRWNKNFSGQGIGRTMKPFTTHTGLGCDHGPLQCRYRPDHSETVSETD